MISLAAVTSTIVKIGMSKAWEKTKRQELVIRLLRQFKLDPDNPPVDFESIYAYTLIEYGIDRPEPILNFFRNKFVKEAFKQSFNKNDISILEKEAEGIIEWNEETNKLGKVDYDPRREFATFSTVFHTIVDRTRPLADVRRDQKLDDIHDDIHQASHEIIAHLDKLEALSDIRIERTQMIQMVSKSPLDVLSQQMREWFNVLNYSFEEYEELNSNYFEWIINIPARRGYDRILVRGVIGEAEMNDLASLRASVAKQKTKEGWLVAIRRISQATREALEREENSNLFCYTFDELLDENADFSGYLTWLENEVKRRGIDTMYVPLAGKKEDFDSISKQIVGQGHYDGKNGWIEGYIDRWLVDPSKEHISILGEFGMGKTWFTLHYAWIQLQRYRDAKERGVERPRLPLVIPLRDYAKAVSVESLFSEFFFRKYEIPLPNYSAFEQLNRMGKLLLIFDGFDEMAERVDRQKMINNFWELARVVIPNAKVILTCRTEHFPEAKEGRALLNAELQASVSNLTGEPPQFEVLELTPFADSQIRKVLSFRTTANVVNLVMNNQYLLDLARRPVMIEFILDALPDIEAGKPIDLSHVYLYAIRQKLERDIKDERTFTSLADKIYFLCELAWEMLSTDQMSLNYRYFPDRIRRFFGPIVQEQKDLDHWHYDMMGQTLLIRNADGDYTPAHRSLLEFFVAYKFAAELGLLAPDFTELAKTQSCLDMKMSALDYTWSSYFCRTLDQKGDINVIAPLKRFTAEKLDKLVETVGNRPLSPAMLDLIENMLDTANKEENNKHLLKIINETKGRTTEEVGYVGGNSATLLLKLDNQALKGLNLVEINLDRAYLIDADLSECNLERANLSGTVLHGVTLRNAILRESLLYDIKLQWLSGKFTDALYVNIMYDSNEQQLVAVNIENKKDTERAKGTKIAFTKRNNTEESVEEINTEYEYPLYALNANKGIIELISKKGELFLFSMEKETFQSIHDSELLPRFYNADLTGARGLSGHNAFILKALGAINVPSIDFNPEDKMQ